MIEVSTDTKLPIKMMTIRKLAETGILPEHAIRSLVKQKRIPALFIGNKALINYYVVEKMLLDLCIQEA